MSKVNRTEAEISENVAPVEIAIRVMTEDNTVTEVEVDEFFTYSYEIVTHGYHAVASCAGRGIFRVHQDLAEALRWAEDSRRRFT